MEHRNIELECYLQSIDWLKQYVYGNTTQEKDDALNKLREVDDFNLIYSLVTELHKDPKQLIINLEKAIKLNKYRPRNMAIFELAICDYLDNIKGEFDTFNDMLTTKDPEQAYEFFRFGLTNLNLLSKQFAADWIDRLNNHKDLVQAARHASIDDAEDVYNKLFRALTNDFCQEYDCQIDSRVVTDWEKSDVDPKNYDERLVGWMGSRGYAVLDKNLSEPERQTVVDAISDYYNGQDIKSDRYCDIIDDEYLVFFYDEISAEKKQKMIEEFRKDPEKYKFCVVRINIANIGLKYPEYNDFFCTALKMFVHEMHHVLDRLCPRCGALGSQIEDVDKKIHEISYLNNEDKYYAAASEISSYKIEEEFLKQLKNTYL